MENDTRYVPYFTIWHTWSRQQNKILRSTIRDNETLGKQQGHVNIKSRKKHTIEPWLINILVLILNQRKIQKVQSDTLSKTGLLCPHKFGRCLSCVTECPTFAEGSLLCNLSRKWSCRVSTYNLYILFNLCKLRSLTHNSLFF